jgi:hypothetical protein
MGLEISGRAFVLLIEVAADTTGQNLALGSCAGKEMIAAALIVGDSNVCLEEIVDR